MPYTFSECLDTECNATVDNLEDMLQIPDDEFGQVTPSVTTRDPYAGHGWLAWKVVGGKTILVPWLPSPRPGYTSLFENVMERGQPTYVPYFRGVGIPGSIYFRSVAGTRLYVPYRTRPAPGTPVRAG